MTKTRNIADLLDANGDVKSGSLDNVPAVDLTNLSASNLTSGTVADARLPSTALNSNVDLTALSASNLTSGTLADARFPATLPAISGANLTNISGGANTPNFRARVTADTGITNNTLTKVIFPTEDYDTASAYNTSDGKFTIPTGQGGKYFIYSQLFLNAGGNNILKQTRTVLYKNGSLLRSSENNYEENRLRRCSVLLNTVENLSVGDYLEIYAVCDSDSGSANLYDTTGNPNYFGAFKIIE